jgi:hypothetical protein
MKILKAQIVIVLLLSAHFSHAQIGIGTTTPKSTLDVYGSFGMKVDTITANTTLDATYGIIICKNTSNITLTMPNSCSSKGRMYFIKRASTGNVTISPYTAQTIDGSATLVLSTANQMVNIVADGVSKWLITQNTTASSSSSATTNTLTSSTNTLTSTVNGVAATASAVNSVSNTSSANNLSTTVNGVTGSNVNIINSNALTAASSALTSTVNGVASTLTPSAGTIGASTYLGFDASGNLVKGATPTVSTTNTLALSTNTLTSTVNGVTATASAIGSVSNTSSTNTLTTTVNGVAGTGVNIINSNVLSVSGNKLTSNINGVSDTTIAVTSVANNSSTNTLTTTVNGVAGTGVNIINSNATSLSGTNLTTTVNGVAATALDLSPAITSKAWSLTGNSGTSYATNFLGTTDNKSLRFKTNNTARMIIDSLGNVGMGTISPSAGLHVVKNSSGTNVITIQNTNAAGFSSMDFYSNGGSLSSTFGFANASAGGIFSGRAYMNSYNNDFVLTRNSSEYSIFIQGSSGNVGIGTNSPGSKLDVSGGLRLDGSTSGYVGLQAAAAAGSTTYTLPSADGTNGQALTTNGSGTLSWATANTFQPTYALVTTTQTTTSTSLVDIPGLSVALSPSSTYEFEAVLTVASSSTAGTNYGINYTGTGTNTVEALIDGNVDLGAGGHTLFQRISALNTSPTNTYNLVTNDGGMLIKGTITTGATAGGNLTVQFKKVTSGTATVYKGSMLKVIKIQ